MKPTPLLISAFVFAAAFGSGCATRYRPISGGYGFSSIQVAADEFEITFKGNGQTSAEEVQEYAVLHAAEVTLKHGYPWFAIIKEERRRRRASRMLEERTTEGNKQTTDQKTISEAGRSVTTGYAVSVPPIRHKGFDRQARWKIECFKGKIDGSRMFDAALLQESIRAKYKIR